jgi:hypothetical protein
MSPNGAVGSQPAGDVGSEDINALVAGSAGDSETGSDLEFGREAGGICQFLPITGG